MNQLSQNGLFSSSNITFQEYIERVKAVNSIEEVIAEEVELKRNKALCPFHDEKTPSFSVNIQRQYFNCFGCQSAGDVVRFIEKIKKIDFKEALKFLAQRAGISPYQWTEEDEKKFKQKKRKQEILSQAAQYYHQKLNNEAKNYLNDRGFNNEILNKYLIGWANGGLKDFLLENGYSLEECQEAKIIKYDPIQKKYVDYFINRIIIPNIVRGNVVHLSGRTLNEEEQKYLHIPGSIEYLWGETNFAGQDVIIVEAPFDAIALIEWGYNAVALFGCGLKNNFIPRLLTAKTLIFLLDGDKAGIEGAEKSGRKLCQIVRLARLPSVGKDPADYFKEGEKKIVDQAIREAKDYIHCQIDKISDQFSDSKNIKHSEIIKRLSPILEVLSELEDSLVEGYLSDFKERFKFSTDEIRALKKSIKSIREASNKESLDSTKEGETEQIALLPGVVIDLCVNVQGKIGFLTIKNGEPSFELEIKKDGKTYVPPPKKAITWFLPRFEEVIRYFKEDSDSILFQTIEEIIKNNVDLPYTDTELRKNKVPPAQNNSKLYLFFTALVIHTHLLDQAKYSPIIILYSDAEHGKTRFGKLLINLSRSGEMTESLNEANIFRKAERFEASIFLDVLDVWKKAERKGSEDVLLCRYERGHTVPRVIRPEKAGFEDTEHYKIFGPTIIASNETAHHILESRGVIVTMEQSQRKFSDAPTEEELLPLKERLTALHVRWMNKKLPEVKKPADHRLGDILKPIYQIISAFAPEKIQDFKYVVGYFKKVRSEAKSDSPQAEIIEVLLNIYTPRGFNARDVLIKDIVEKINKERDPNYPTTSIAVGKRLSAMGFKKGRNKNCRIMVWDEELLDRLAVQYGLQDPQESGESGLSDERTENTTLEDAKCNAESNDSLNQSDDESTNSNLPKTDLTINWQTANPDLISFSSDSPGKPDNLDSEELNEREAIQQEGGKKNDLPFK